MYCRREESTDQTLCRYFFFSFSFLSISLRFFCFVTYDRASVLECFSEDDASSDDGGRGFVVHACKQPSACGSSASSESSSDSDEWD